MNYLKTLIIALLFPVVALASPWDTQYKQIEQSIRCPQFADRTFNITKYGASTQATAKKNQTAINKAILDANLGFTPRHEGDLLRIVIPPLTEERRKELCKAAKTEIENAKVNVRNVRRNVMDKVKKLKDKSVPEDEVKQVEKDLQDITDKNIAECDKIYAAKEKEIMSI